MLVCLEEGYDVISMDHAFAPAYRFPVPLLQLDELISHLQAHEKEYGINTKKIILAGSGSGADIAVQYAAACSDPAYIPDIKGNKIAGLYLPTMLFVLCGFEHSVANMYFIPAGMMAASFHGIASAASFGSFLLGNLLPVTIGNLIGGAGFVAAGLYLLFGDRSA